MRVKAFKIFGSLMLVAFLASCAETQLASHYVKRIWKQQTPSTGEYKVGNPYKIGRRTYYPKERFNYSQTGIASWYGPGFNGKKTANGEIYNQRDLTAAHKTLQMPALVRVTNLENGRSVVVRINDRGPFKPGRIIDMSERGAELLGFKSNGIARVRLDVLEQESRQLAAAAKAGKDTSRINVAKLNTPVTPSVVQPPITPEPSRSVLLDDARTIDDPVLEHKEALIDALKIETIEAEPLEVIQATPATPASSSTAGGSTANEFSYLDELDFIKESRVKGHSDGGRFIPDPVVEQYAAQKTDIFIQAGAFTSDTNAGALSKKLSNVGRSFVVPVDVGGTTFYRVRLGPIKSIAEADAILLKVIDLGQDQASIIIEE